MQLQSNPKQISRIICNCKLEITRLYSIRRIIHLLGKRTIVNLKKAKIHSK
jgi:hypothetical protein